MFKREVILVFSECDLEIFMISTVHQAALHGQPLGECNMIGWQNSALVPSPPLRVNKNASNLPPNLIFFSPDCSAAGWAAR